ncbi:hypothetical protein [Nonomuraea sp. SYSU D8015]|uniref:hypothetical protein n=1 Tax=Nonomuraea sp. SYSU D8015 TaxID=2593644 RepID=UPI0016615C3F|nr:hypothetical protein [Nonomuraea sp. SYSU D8015]
MISEGPSSHSAAPSPVQPGAEDVAAAPGEPAGTRRGHSAECRHEPATDDETRCELTSGCGYTKQPPGKRGPKPKYCCRGHADLNSRETNQAPEAALSLAAISDFSSASDDVVAVLTLLPGQLSALLSPVTTATDALLTRLEDVGTTVRTQITAANARETAARNAAERDRALAAAATKEAREALQRATDADLARREAEAAQLAAETKRDEIENKRAELSKELGAALTARDNLQKVVDGQYEQLLSVRAQLTDVERQSNELREALTAREQALRERSHELLEEQQRAARLQQRHVELAADLDNVRRQLASAQEEARSAHGDRRAAHARLETSAEQLGQARQQNADLTAEVSRLSALREGDQERIRLLQMQVDDLHGQREELRAEVAALRAERASSSGGAVDVDPSPQEQPRL